LPLPRAYNEAVCLERVYMGEQIERLIITEEIKNSALSFIDAIEQTEIPFTFPVIGDFIIDKYRYCKTERKNLEHDGLIHDLVDASHYYGGASNVANIIGTFSTPNIQTLFYSGCGRADVDYLRRIELNNPKTFKLLLYEDISYERVLPVKTRYISQSRSEYLFRVDSEPTKTEFPHFNSMVYKAMLEDLREINTNSLFISDYNKGFISDELLTAIRGMRSFTRIYCNIRPKKIFKYIGYMYLLSFNKTEFIQAYDEVFNSSIDVISLDDILAFKDYVKVKNLIITFGSNGYIFCGEHLCCIKVDSFKNLSIGSKNIIGAGDMVSAAFAFFDSINYNFFLDKYGKDVILYLVNCAAFLKVYTGDYTISFDLLKSYINGKLCLF
jgi:bifunctional ADP-heptose synthase (sugar kinase/adenylyltransferase)